ncbi:hypothetical protein [Streptomyces sp. NBC_01264]|uniref:hypothetical protein n=1 Tax=Streptomyces sp. NBC_01264 TaxID=2903804 RepID=UPI0022532FC4|nr:hypothetical protein [Streptomyces sp. NBC_01264]MCX4783596.1 hypothetical protein [Streptomyces sp. NBC_01264]
MVPALPGARHRSGPSGSSARAAIAAFLSSLPGESTRSLRRTYLQEYTAHLATTHDCREADLTLADLLDPAHATAWLDAAARGETRRRNSLRGPAAPASANSMAARTSTLNTFSAHAGHPLTLTVPKPEFAPRLSPTEAHRTLKLLTAHQPDGILTSTWERTVALIALAVTTGHGLAHLQPMTLDDLQLDRPLPRARTAGAWYPLDTVSRHAVARWHDTHHALTAGHRKTLHGGDVHQLWVTTAPGRPRGNRPAPPAGLPAARRPPHARSRPPPPGHPRPRHTPPPRTVLPRRHQRRLNTHEGEEPAAAGRTPATADPLV